MSITFKRFHGSDRMSQETTCYDTDVLFDGQPLGHCRNDGNGGQGIFHTKAGVDAKLVERAEAWAKQQIYRELDGSAALMDGKPMTMDSIDEYCDYLASETMDEKRIVAQVKRHLKSKALFLDPARDNDIISLKGAYTGQAMKEAIEKRYPGAIILNELPLEQAVSAFKAQAVKDEARAGAEPPPATPTGGRKAKR